MKINKIINLTDAVKIGSGIERSVYVHPDNPNQLVKVVHPDEKDSQTKREVAYYEKLIARLPDTAEAWKHIPHFYGVQATNRGDCPVFEAIRDFDGEISKTFQFYLERDGLALYRSELDELKCYLLKYAILINSGIIWPVNLVLKRVNENEQILVVVDALGDPVAIKFFNLFPYFVKQKILRRWERLEKNLLKYANSEPLNH
ncbi:MAG: hypothetical protein CR974_03150 [Gammaproteobacteria bacterium]|nr:MAG: hypothetical protein CR974_03150 [Gammaproteobacteria bacterium]